MSGEYPASAIAVTGMACRFPGAPDIAAFWRNLCSAKSSIQRFDRDEMLQAGTVASLLDQRGFVPACAPIPDAYAFDAAHFGMTPGGCSMLDLQHRVFLETAWSALEASGTFAAGRSAVGVFAGCSDPTYVAETDDDDQSGALAASLGSSSDFLASRVAFALDLHGPAVSVRAACATSLLAVHLAVQSLLTYECDVALAGGVAIRHPLRRGHQHVSGGIYSEDDRCRPYDKLGTGIVSGDGAGAVVLRRLADALASDEPIHAVILGSAVSNDGARKGSFTAPSVVGQVEAMLAALEVADVDPATIGFVEGHGTATPMGDPIEVEALKRAWRSSRSRRGCCWLGSVKSNIGHLDAASGIAGFIKACLCVEHGRIPGTLNFSEPNPECALGDSPFCVSADLVEWTEPGPRRASVNSLGLGGTNVHVVLQQQPSSPREPVAPEEADTPVVLTLSARRREALTDYATALAEAMKGRDLDAAAIAATLQRGRVAERYRSTVIGNNEATLLAGLTALAEPKGPASSPARAALVFSGDGKRSFGGIARLAKHLPAIATTIGQAADHLRSRWDLDLAAVLQNGSSVTRGILAAKIVEGVAVYAGLRAFGVMGDIVLGQSLGELSAAVAAELITLPEALDLAMAREQVFRSVVGSGAISVLCPAEELRKRLPPGVEISLVNSPYRCVVSARHEALAEFAAMMAKENIFTYPLELISAVHSSLLDPVLGEFREAAACLNPRPPARTLITSVGGGLVVDHLMAANPDHWVVQLREPVYFDQCLRAAVTDRSTVIVDMSLAGSLSGTIRESVGEKARAVIRLAPVDESGSDIEAFGRALGEMWDHGIAVDWSAWPRRNVKQLTLPVPPLARSLHPLSGVGRGFRKSKWDKAGTVALWQRAWRRLSLEPGIGVRRSVAIIAQDATWGTKLTSILARAGHEVRSVFDANGLDNVGPIDFVVDARSLDFGIDFVPVGEFLELAERCAAREKPPRMLVVIRGAFDIIGNEALSPGAAALAHAALVTAQEHPELGLVAVDVPNIEDDERLADVIGLDVDPGIMTGIRGNSIWHAAAERRNIVADIPAGRISGPCVITGGLGRFGRRVGRWLAASGATDLFLLGRTAALSPAADQAIAAMRQAGARVSFISIDLVDTCRVREVLDEVQAKFAMPLTIFHLAGQPHAPSAYAPVVDLVQGGVWTALAEQWSAKVQGAIALRDWARNNRRSRFIMFSSNASILGGPGLAAYAAANAAVDSLATVASRREGLDWHAISWDGWRLEDDAPNSAPSALEAFALRGDEPFMALSAVMCLPGGHVTVAKGDFSERHRTWVETRGAMEGGAKRPVASPDPKCAATATDISTVIRSIWSEVLGPPATDDVNLFEVGGDSLSAMRIRSQIERVLSTRLTIQQVLKNATVAKLVALVMSISALPKDTDLRPDSDRDAAKNVIRGRL